MDLPSSLLKSLADARYDKRKAAALEIENLTRRCLSAGQHDRIMQIVDRLCQEFALSPEPNHRKGGLIGLAALTVGLGPGASDDALSHVLPPVLQSVLDPDARVRYSACESLYNILKISRTKFLPFFLSVFDALTKLVADPDPNVQNAANLLSNLLKDVVAEGGSDPSGPRLDLAAVVDDLTDKLRAVNPFVRQFLVSWIALLDSVPNMGVTRHLDRLLGPLLDVLCDSQREIRSATQALLKDLIEEVRTDPRASQCDVAALTALLVQRGRAALADPESGSEIDVHWTCLWLETCVHVDPSAALRSKNSFIGTLQLVLRYVGSADAQTCHEATALSGSMRRFAETNAALEASDLPRVFEVLERELRSPEELSRLEALQWVRCLIRLFASDQAAAPSSQFAAHLASLVASMTEALFATDPRVVAVAGDILEGLAFAPEYFERIMVGLLDLFRGADGPQLMTSKGVTVLRNLMERLGPERVLIRLAAIVVEETQRALSESEHNSSSHSRSKSLVDASHHSNASTASAPSSVTTQLRFASFVAQSLNWILFTAPELEPTRLKLKNSDQGGEGRTLVDSLYPCWSQSVSATLSLVLLAGLWDLASELVQSFASVDPSPSALAQLDRLVRMFEAPAFSALRLALLSPEKNDPLVFALRSILAVLPQGEAFSLLDARLRSLAAPPSAAPKHGQKKADPQTTEFVELFRNNLKLQGAIV